MARCPDCIHQYCCKYDRFFGVNEVENKCIYFKPTADVVEVKHGEWLSNAQTDEYICSECDGIAPVDSEKEEFYESNYCPNCGAKMDKKESEGFSDV